MALAGVVVALFVFKLTVYAFLAPNRPLGGDYLVVEGWVPNYALSDGMEIFKRGGYKKILTSGGQAKGLWSMEHKVTYAVLAAQYMRNSGMSGDLVEPVPGELVVKDRTYSSALAVKKWLQANAPAVTKVDVLTVGPHARRSRMLFEKALGQEISVGVIAIDDAEYDPQHWWRTSEGVREVISETIAYVYARFFFHPMKNPDGADFN